MKTIIGVSFAALYGLSMRVVFGFLDGLMGVMSIAFLIMLPVFIGFLTIILIPKEKTTSASGAFFKPWLTSLAILFITLAFNIEGSICWVMIFPLFAIMSGIGGLIAYSTRKRNAGDEENDNDWQTPDVMKVSFIMLIPLVVGVAEGDKGLTQREMTISKTINIPAPAPEVWKQLVSADQKSVKMDGFALPELLGFPKHIHTSLDNATVGGKRMAYYDKGLYFEETISKIEPERQLVLDIKTDPSKIPANVMDEHIVIGGKHVDIKEDAYQLKSLPDGSTQLTLSSRFMINTPFNWYAAIWANYLMKDILDGQLAVIKAGIKKS